MGTIKRSNSMDEHLYQSCKDGNVNRVKLLLELGASPNVQDLDAEYQLSTLAAAAMQNMFTASKTQQQIVALLLQHGANPALRNRKGLSLLHYCAQYSQDPKMMKLILQSRKVSTNLCDVKGNTPLHLLCKYNSDTSVAKEKARLLIQHQADPLMLNLERESPLCYVSFNANYELLAVLLNVKNVTIANGDPLAKCTPIDNVAKGYVHHSTRDPHFSQYYKCIDLLLKKGANINIPRLSGSYPLFYTIKFRSYAMTKFLLTRNANPNITDINGHNVLSYAYNFCTTLLSDLGDIDKILLESGVNPNSKTSGKLPISYLLGTNTVFTNKELWFDKVKINLQAGLNLCDEKRLCIILNDIDLSQSDILFLHKSGHYFDKSTMEDIYINNKNCKNQADFIRNLQNEPLSLQFLAAKVIRLNLKPNALKGTKILKPPKVIANIITLGYLYS